MQLHDTAIGALLALLGIAVIWHAGSFPEIAGQSYGPGLFPRLAGSGLLLFGTGLLLRGLRAGAGRLLTLPPAADLRRAVVAGLYILGAVLAIVLLGERIGIQIVVFAILLGGLLAAWRRPLAALMLALALTCAFDAVFRLLLRVPLPSGFLTGVL